MPPGERWLGSPAEPVGPAPAALAQAACGRVRRLAFGLLQAAISVLLWTPLILSVMFVVLPEYDELGDDRRLSPATGSGRRLC